jgi:hypothetical protein
MLGRQDECVSLPMHYLSTHYLTVLTEIMDWKYKSDFLSTEDLYYIEENESLRLKWEKNYTMSFYLSIYH